MTTTPASSRPSRTPLGGGSGGPDATEAPPRPRGRIVFTFLLALLLAGLVPLAMVAQKLMTISRESLVTSQQEVQLQMASAIARQIEAAIDARVAEVARLAEGIAPGRGDAAARSLDGYLGGGLVLLRAGTAGEAPQEARRAGLEL
ncbi:MAG: hypothetical protein L0027_00740, partial [Candidatus Rokubacteria bacterium]|nr:hypothetical protein [Candidatus Rokubacteria bacterium]